MKVYIRAARTVEQLEQQEGQGLPKPMLRRLIALDPTSDYDNGKGGKYCPWIIRMYKNKLLTEDNFLNLQDALEMFAKDYKKYPKSDLNQYKDVEEFLQDTHDVGNRELTDKEKKKLLKKQAHHASTEDKKFCVEEGDWEVWQPLTYAGSISLAREGGEKASWCTAYEGNDNWWRSYTRQGPLYIFLNRKDPRAKMQLHIPTKSWYDFNDSSKGMSRFYQFCAEHPVIGDYFKVETVGGVVAVAGSIVQYDESATEIVIPDSVEQLPKFKFPSSCTKVTLPDTITTIPPRAFEDSSIEVVEANNLQKIGPAAFKGTPIREIDLSHVTVFGTSAFRFCGGLRNLRFSTEPVHLGAFVFCETGLTQVTITPNVDMNMSAFDTNPNLVVIWKGTDDYDEDYCKFVGIKELVIDPAKYPNVFAANEGSVDIRTPNGEVIPK